MRKLVVISDWATDSVKTQEFRSVLEGFMGEQTPEVSFVPVSSNSFEAGFVLGELEATEAAYGRAHETVFLLDITESEVKPELEPLPAPELLLAKTASGAFSIGVNRGYSFSFLPTPLEELLVFAPDNSEKTVGARETTAELCAIVMQEQENTLTLDDRDFGVIPQMRGAYVGRVDAQGNIITTLTRDALKDVLPEETSKELTLAAETHSVYYLGQHPQPLTDSPLVFVYDTTTHQDNPKVIIKSLEAGKSAKDFFANVTAGDELVFG